MSSDIRNFFNYVIRGDIKKVKGLLPHIDINSIDEKGDGDTALIKALYMDNGDMVTLLLENGADPNIKNYYGENAFSFPHFEELHKLYKARQRLVFSQHRGIVPDLIENIGTLVKGGSKSKKRKLRKSSKVKKSRKARKSRKSRRK